MIRRTALRLLPVLATLCAFPLRAQPDLLAWCGEHPDRVSLAWFVNGELVAEHQADQPLPLASTVKLLLAAEFARRAGEDALDPELLVPAAELERFHVPGTDGGAHEAWKAAAREADLLGEEGVPLWAVVRGMLRYSSNANAEYLMHLYGREATEALPAAWGLSPHTPVYPLVGAMYIERSLDLPPHRIAEALRTMDLGAYRALAWAWSDSLAADYGGRHTGIAPANDLSVQRVWSNRMPASSARAYAGFAERLRSGSVWTDDAADWWRQVAERVDGDTGVRSGGKGGSTGFLLNWCRYGETEEGTGHALALFLHELNPLEMRALSAGLPGFEERLWSDPEYAGAWGSLFPPDGE
jgi:D-alanyl-D-alanine carboxypeptidase